MSADKPRTNALLISVGLILWTAFSFRWCFAAEQTRTIHLRETVEVNHPVVFLSDLLPADTPPAIQQAGRVIAICHAPQPGSGRVLQREQILGQLAAYPGLTLTLVVPPRVMIRNPGWPIAESHVRTAISEFLQAHGRLDFTDSAELDLPALAASQPGFTLQVIRMEWDTRQQAVEARLRCSSRASCAPFLVRVGLTPSFSDHWRDELSSRKGINSIALPAASFALLPPLTARGKPSTLILEDRGMRISVPVVCLEAGTLNQRIRVFDKQSRRVFLAEIVGDSLLRARL